MKGMTREWALTFAFSGAMFLALAFGLTWVNIERTDMAYELRRLQTDIDAQSALISKLEVERDTLTTPDRLRSLAAQYGLTQAKPGQIRRLADTGQDLPSPALKTVPALEKPQKKARTAPGGKGRKTMTAEGKTAGNKQGPKNLVQTQAAQNSVGGTNPEAEGGGVTIGAVKP